MIWAICSPSLAPQVEMLKFYLRMGFEDLGTKDEHAAPISGVMGLPLPSSLAEAAKGLCSAAEVKKCVAKGARHTHPSTRASTGTRSHSPTSYSEVIQGFHFTEACVWLGGVVGVSSFRIELFPPSACGTVTPPPLPHAQKDSGTNRNLHTCYLPACLCLRIAVVLIPV